MSERKAMTHQERRRLLRKWRQAERDATAEQPEPEPPGPLTTDYRYGGCGKTDREDVPVPNGWKKGI